MSSLAASNPVPAVKGEDGTNPRVFFITGDLIKPAGENEEDDKFTEQHRTSGVHLSPWGGICCGPLVDAPVLSDNFEIPNEILVRSGLSEA